jgi:AcrR family transcriptional regulator
MQPHQEPAKTMSSGRISSNINRAGLEHDMPSRNEVDDIQRARIVLAMIEMAARLGYIGAAVAPVVARAGVSRRTFYKLFDGREDCFLAAFDWGVERARAAMFEAQQGRRTWRELIRGALAGLLVLFDDEPELARVCVIETLAAGQLVLARRSQVVSELITALGVGAPRPRGGADVPLLTTEGVVGGALSVIHARLLEQAHQVGADSGTSGERGEGDGARPLLALHGQLMALIVLPYLGPAAAGEELTRDPPQLPPRERVGARPDAGGVHPFERLDMRLTYRTVRCLMFIAENPGSSNREIAKGADIPDEGQASKLLARLVKLDLIVNSQPHGPGFPNRWALTADGKHMLGVVGGR